jgi:hypothetical protein
MFRKVKVFGRRSATLLQGHCNSVEIALGEGRMREDQNSIQEFDDAVTIVEAGGAGRRCQLFYAKGHLSRVPANFVFPKITLCTLMTSWFYGNESAQTVPYKLLKGVEIKSKGERYKLLQVKLLMAAVESGARGLGVWPDRSVGVWDVGSTVWLYERVNHLFWYPSKLDKICRNKQISWQTMFNLFLWHFGWSGVWGHGRGPNGGW